MDSFTKLYSEVAQDTSIPYSHRAVYSLIFDYCKYGYHAAFAKAHRYATELRISERSVASALKTLTELGWIEKKGGPPRPCVYRARMPLCDTKHFIKLYNDYAPLYELSLQQRAIYGLLWKLQFDWTYRAHDEPNENLKVPHKHLPATNPKFIMDALGIQDPHTIYTGLENLNDIGLCWYELRQPWPKMRSFNYLIFEGDQSMPHIEAYDPSEGEWKGVAQDYFGAPWEILHNA